MKRKLALLRSNRSNSEIPSSTTGKKAHRKSCLLKEKRMDTQNSQPNLMFAVESVQSEHEQGQQYPYIP